MSVSDNGDPPLSPPMAYEERGDGRPLILLHGSYLDRRFWKPQLEALSDEFRVIAPDLRGHGETGTPDDLDEYSVETYSDDLHEFVRHLDLDEKPVVCGLSLGGIIAQKFAADYPGEAAGFVSVNAVSPDMTSLSRRWEYFTDACTASTARLLGPERVGSVMAWLVEKTTSGVDEELVEIGNDYLTEHAQTLPKVVDSFSRNYGDVDYDAIADPFLVAYSEGDSDLVADQSMHVHDSVEDSSLEVIRDADHAASWENPEAFNELVRRFARDVTDD